MEINYKALTERLSARDKRVELVNFIYATQGCELRRLNYGAAAEALHVDWKTVSRYCTQLAQMHVISFIGDQLKLNDEILQPAN
ncbi:MAG: hypothetical protein J6B04_05575 [Clostridia bacterium]|nr:hypothetical protein [Clostridia bacterium]